MKLRVLLAGILAACLVAACAPSTDPDEPRPGTEPPAPTLQALPDSDDPVMVQVPERNAWTVRRIAGFDLPADARLPTLRLDAETAQASGFAGVNRFTGSYELDAEGLSFGPLASTRMAGPPEAMALEQVYLEALSRVDSWRMRDERLELLAEGQRVLTFEAGESGDGADDQQDSSHLDPRS